MKKISAVNDFVISAEMCCRSSSQLELARMIHERDLKRRPVQVRDANGVAVVVIPDAWLDFRLRTSYQLCVALEQSASDTCAHGAVSSCSQHRA